MMFYNRIVLQLKCVERDQHTLIYLDYCENTFLVTLRAEAAFGQPV